jgi:ABC-type molybdenum transport system ATPase subunit/photorepair protein PhrA
MTTELALAPLIEFSNAALGYGRKTVLSNISFAVHDGEYFGLVGPNGAGKTTILRAILGTLDPLAGQVRVRSAAGGKLRFGYVPQRDTIDYVLPYTVEEVVMMGRYRSMGLLRGRARDLGRTTGHGAGLCLAAHPVGAKIACKITIYEKPDLTGRPNHKANRRLTRRR